VRENFPKVVISTTVDPSLLARVDLLAAELGLSRCKLLREVIRAEIDRLLDQKQVA